MTDNDLDTYRKAYLNHDHALYRHFLRRETLAVLDEATYSDDFAGATDPTALSLIATVIKLIRPEAILQLGTFVGFSSLIIADLLSNKKKPGRLVTVEPVKQNHDRARKRIARAGLQDVVTFVDGLSTDSIVKEQVKNLGKYQLMYIDSSHTYHGTIQELKTYVETNDYLVENGIILLHDAGRNTPEILNLPEGDGGVPRALYEFSREGNTLYPLTVLDVPIWPNQCGFAILSKAPYKGKKRGYKKQLSARTKQITKRFLIKKAKKLDAV